MNLQRLWAVIIGSGSVIVGVMRFFSLDNVAGWETAEPIHGLLHLGTGAAWLASVWWQRGEHAEGVNRWLGVFWLVVGLAGNLGLLESVESLAFDDNAVHLIIATISLAVGWRRAAMAALQK